MRVLLYKLNTVADEIIPPLSLGYLAASAPAHDVDILDGQKDGLCDEDVARICEERGVEIFGVQVWTKDLSQARTLLRLLKSRLPDLVTVIGGVQTSVMPEQTYRFFGDCLDYAFWGEAEAGFGPWLNALAAGSLRPADIPGLIWRENGEVRKTAPAPFENLDDIPLPRWDLMPPASYPPAPHGAFFRNFPATPIITSRGCPFACTFCSAPVLSGRRIRFRSLDNIFSEVRILRERYGVRELHVEDDNFSIHKPFVMEFCRRMEAEAPGMTWAFPNGVRLDTLDDEMLAAMRRAGCYALNFGIESGDDETLRRIRKKTTTAEIAKRLDMARRHGFWTGGFFILGFPWETEAHVERTIEFALRLPLDAAGFSYFQPFPGTEEARLLAESGEFAIDLEHFDTSLHTVSYVPHGLTEESLRRLRLKAMQRFYFRPRNVLGILKRASSPRHAYYILKRGLRWLTT